MRVKMLDRAPPHRAEELSRILTDLEALASEIRTVSPCQTAIVMAIAVVRACGVAWTGESWGTGARTASGEEMDADRAMRSSAEHVERLGRLRYRLQSLGTGLRPGTPDDQALDAAILALKLCGMEWTGDVFAFTPRHWSPQGRP